MVNIEQMKRSFLLLNAVKNGDIETVKSFFQHNMFIKILNKIKNVPRSIDKNNSLILASYYGHIEIVKILLNNGANVNFLHKDGDSSLNIASREGHTEIVKILLHNGANINYINKDRRGSLIISSSKGHTEIVKLLLDNGANFHHIYKSWEYTTIITSHRPVLDVFYKYLIENEKYVIHICN